MVPGQLKIILIEVDSDSYRVKLSEPPGSGNNFTIYERFGSSHYSVVGTILEANWDTGVTLTGRVPGRTYFVLAIGSDVDSTVLAESSITLAPQGEVTSNSVGIIPDWKLTSSNDPLTRHEVGRRSEKWKQDYPT